MAKWDKYHPDYKRLYADKGLTPEIMELLKRSDRKMEYMEVDIKQGAFRQDLTTRTAVFISSREDSLERLQEEDKAEFPSAAPLPEDEVIHNDEIIRLRKALKMLEPEEYEMIHALYYKGISEETLAQQVGITQQGISWRLKKSLAKIKNFMEI